MDNAWILRFSEGSFVNAFFHCHYSKNLCLSISPYDGFMEINVKYLPKAVYLKVSKEPNH